MTPRLGAALALPRHPIQVVARRTGLSADVIRAWERRYGLLTPTRSEGNYRLYSPQDVTRLRLMRHYVHQDISPSRAAALVAQSKARLQGNPGVPAGDARATVMRLRGALERFEDAEADRLLDRLAGVFTPAVVLRDVILPYLRELEECRRRRAARRRAGALPDVLSGELDAREGARADAPE